MDEHLDQHLRELLTVRSMGAEGEAWVNRDDLVRVLTMHAAAAAAKGRTNVARELAWHAQTIEKMGQP